ncbi:uncharacterized protein C3orf38 homolog isoform X2 [Anguilla rostrata]|uniref:uncharacterized protein C3orf38 homolog isoform X2 n=1 Tax=Anguilla anguilla TaxID=7936 RepID=UPI0015AA8D7D|nr:uncharacterized protein C3orf38 homolog isoform X2 [Anguilla anguilla]
MSGLSGTEQEGCRKMLSLLSYSDLMALCDTVTNKLITVVSTGEAMDAILTCSKSAEELLKRRKVYREVIFKYLISEGIAMPPDADKNQLARRAMLFWALNSRASYVSTPADEEMDFSSAGEEISACDYMALGKQFCQWFYNPVNTQNPTLGQEPLHWGPQHFWEDAWLILCYSAEVQKIDRFQGAELVSQNLLALVRDERLFFSPNLEPHGLKCEATPHGLVMAAVAGTIHREQACLGIFEQAFGLIRSPLDANSWKIKFTHLRMRGQNELTGGEEMTSPAVTYSSNELLSLCERGLYF